MININLLKSVSNQKKIIVKDIPDDLLIFEDDNYLMYYSVVKVNSCFESVHDFVLFMLFDSRVANDIRLKSLRELIIVVIINTKTDAGLARLCDAIWKVTLIFSEFVEDALYNCLDFFDNEHVFGIMSIENFHNAMVKGKVCNNYNAELLDNMNYNDAEFFYDTEDCPLNFIPEYLALIDSFNNKNVFDNPESIIAQIFKDDNSFFIVTD